MCVSEKYSFRRSELSDVIIVVDLVGRYAIFELVRDRTAFFRSILLSIRYVQSLPASAVIIPFAFDYPLNVFVIPRYTR